MNNKFVTVASAALFVLISAVPTLTTATDKPLPVAADSGISVLDRFRTYSGPHTPAALTALFAAQVKTTISQQPLVVLTDGVTTVKISIADQALNSKAPNVALEGGKLISLTPNKANEWDIEALPSAGALKASLILLADSFTREIPLTVAPALPAGTDLSEKGFIAFLGETKASSQPLLDLNNDGRRNYIDDYIFTANYLVNLRLAADVPNAAQPMERQIPAIAQPSETLMPNSGAESAPLSTNSSEPPADKGLSEGQTPYQRSLVDRNQRARELTERMKGKVPTTGTPAAVPPPR